MKTIPGSKEYDPSYTIPKWERHFATPWATYLYENPAPVTLKGA